MNPKEMKILPMGTPILVGKIVKAGYEEIDDPLVTQHGPPLTRRVVVPITRWNPPKTGVFVGYGHLQEGKYKQAESNEGPNGEPDSWPPYITEIKSVLVARVRFHPRGVEHKALPEDIELLPAVPNP